MSLTTRELNQLKKIVELANKLLAKSVAVDVPNPRSIHKGNGVKRKPATKPVAKMAKKATSADASPQTSKRTRRSGAELVAFRKLLVAERKRGVSAAELAKTHGVSAAYIYQL